MYGGQYVRLVRTPPILGRDTSNVASYVLNPDNQPHFIGSHWCVMMYREPSGHLSFCRKADLTLRASGLAQFIATLSHHHPTPHLSQAQPAQAHIYQQLPQWACRGAKALESAILACRVTCFYVLSYLRGRYRGMESTKVNYLPLLGCLRK